MLIQSIWTPPKIPGLISPPSPHGDTPAPVTRLDISVNPFIKEHLYIYYFQLFTATIAKTQNKVKLFIGADQLPNRETE